MATKIFLLASTSRVLRCQCPMVTPASLGGNDCAHVVPAARKQITHTGEISLVSLFIADPLFEGEGASDLSASFRRKSSKSQIGAIRQYYWSHHQGVADHEATKGHEDLYSFSCPFVTFVSS